MSYFSWQDIYKLGIEKVDIQHQKLVELISDLLELVILENNHQKIEDILNELIKYTEYHFAEEEKLMIELNFPNFEVHKKIHQSFVEKINEFYAKYSRGEIALEIQILNYLKTWLINHILITDKEFANFYINIQNK